MSATKRKIDLNYNPYSVLGIESSSSEKEIDKAYKKSALKWHPDKNPDNLAEAQKKFVDLYKAYEFLKNKELKTEYDEAIAAKKRRAQYDIQRQATSSAKRKYFIDKLEQKEKASEERTTPTAKKKSTPSTKNMDDAQFLKKLRREGAQLLKKMEEERVEMELAARKREEEKRRKEHEDFVKANTHPQAHMYDISLDEMAALEDEILG